MRQIQFVLTFSYDKGKILITRKSCNSKSVKTMMFYLSPYEQSIIKHFKDECFQNYISDILYVCLVDEKGTRIIRTRNKECSYINVHNLDEQECNNLIADEVSRFERYCNLDEKLKYVFTGKSNERYSFVRMLSVPVVENDKQIISHLKFSQFDIEQAETILTSCKFSVNRNFEVFNNGNIIARCVSLAQCYNEIGNFIFEKIYPEVSNQ